MKSEFIKTSKGIINSDHICSLRPDEDINSDHLLTLGIDEDVERYWVITLSGGDCIRLPEAEAKDLTVELLGLIFSPNEEASQEEQ